MPLDGGHLHVPPRNGGGEHRVRIDIPGGIEFTIAEIGSASTRADAAIKLDLSAAERRIAEQPAEAAEQFLFEARATARFSHPNIVTVYAVGEHHEIPYVALEYLEGQTLRRRMDGERLSVRESMRVGLAVAEALMAGLPVVTTDHRDLKMMVGPDRGRIVEAPEPEPIARAIRDLVPYYLHFSDEGHDPDARDYEVSYERIRGLGFETEVTLDLPQARGAPRLGEISRGDVRADVDDRGDTVGKKRL